MSQLQCKQCKANSGLSTFWMNCYFREKKDGEQKNNTIQSLKSEIACLREFKFVPEEQSDFSDVVLCTSDGTRLEAHRFILASRSPVFRAMFNIDLKEKRTGEIQINEVGGEVLKVFVKFVYTGHASDDEIRSNYRDLVKLSHLYQVKCVLLMLDEFISVNILAKPTSSVLLKMAYTYELDKTKQAALQMIADDPVDKLFDMTVKELEDDPSMALDFCKSVVHRRTKRTRR